MRNSSKIFAEIIYEVTDFIKEGKNTSPTLKIRENSHQVDSQFSKKEKISKTDQVHEKPPFVFNKSADTEEENLQDALVEASSKTKAENLDKTAIEAQPKKGILENLQDQVQHCMKCTLCTHRTYTVFGEGDPKSLLYVVGEAPGINEDLEGRPFIGEAGELFGRMLEAIAVSRDKIFLTNVVKCRPPKNRDPQRDEITACSEYLEQQLEYGKPRFILALGRFSTGYFFDDFETSLSELRKKDFFYKDKKVFATYHPSAVLKSPERYKSLVWEDLKKVALELKEAHFYSDDELEILRRNKVIN